MTIKKRTPLSFRRQSIIDTNDDAPLLPINAEPEKSCIRGIRIDTTLEGVQDFSLPSGGRNDRGVWAVEMTVGCGCLKDVSVQRGIAGIQDFSTSCDFVSYLVYFAGNVRYKEQDVSK